MLTGRPADIPRELLIACSRIRVAHQLFGRTGDGRGTFISLCLCFIISFKLYIYITESTIVYKRLSEKYSELAAKQTEKYSNSV